LLELLGGGEDDLGEQGRAKELADTARRAAADALLPEQAGFVEEMGNFYASLAPFAAGERTLAVLPFVLAIR
jgi:hypothetical protein